MPHDAKRGHARRGLAKRWRVEALQDKVWYRGRMTWHATWRESSRKEANRFEIDLNEIRHNNRSQNTGHDSLLSTKIQNVSILSSSWRLNCRLQISQAGSCYYDCTHHSLLSSPEVECCCLTSLSDYHEVNTADQQEDLVVPRSAATAPAANITAIRRLKYLPSCSPVVNCRCNPNKWNALISPSVAIMAVTSRTSRGGVRVGRWVGGSRFWRVRHGFRGMPLPYFETAVPHCSCIVVAASHVLCL